MQRGAVVGALRRVRQLFRKVPDSDPLRVWIEQQMHE